MDKAEWIEWHVAHAGMIKALIAGTFISISCGVIGCFIILRRMAFLADAVAHSMLAGVVASYLIFRALFDIRAHSVIILVGALLAGLLTAALIGFVTRVSRIKEDAAIGIMYTGIFALGGFFASIKALGEYIDIDLVGFIAGSVVATSLADLWTLAIICCIVFTVVILFYRQLLLTSFDPVMAAAIGIPVLGIEYLLTACTSLVVVSGVNIVGVILVVALLITPAATAYLLFDRLNHMLVASALFGMLGFYSGYFVSLWIGNAPGPSVVVMSSLIFLVTLALAPRYGLIADWIRKRNQIPQELMEDILGYLMKNDGVRKERDIVKNVTVRNHSTRAAIRSLIRNGLALLSGGRITLTSEGTAEARRLRRAHRLWESYLSSTGLDSNEIHQQAHLLEHVHDEDAVDYLDHKLGHPLTDPHGSEIPQDFVHTESGSPVRLSLLREGDVAEILEPGCLGSRADCQPGAMLEVGPRREKNVWTATVKDSGKTIELEHDDADTVLVLKKN